MTPLTASQIDVIARACHEANRAWCLAHGDDSQRGWDVAEKWQRESARRGVSVALSGAGPREQHEAWSRDKIADGWVYGTVKDATAKTHPCLVAYDALPASQQAKDGIYIAVVRAFAAAFAAVPHVVAAGTKLMNRVADVSQPVAAKIMLEVEGESAEGPGVVRFRRGDEDPWTEVQVLDMSDAVGRLGTDVNWPHMRESVKAWLAGGSVDPVLAWLAEGMQVREEIEGLRTTRRDVRSRRRVMLRAWSVRLRRQLGERWTTSARPRGYGITLRRDDRVRLHVGGFGVLGRWTRPHATLYAHGLTLRGTLVHALDVLAKLDRLKSRETIEAAYAAAEAAVPPVEMPQHWKDITLTGDPHE